MLLRLAKRTLARCRSTLRFCTRPSLAAILITSLATRLLMFLRAALTHPSHAPSSMCARMLTQESPRLNRAPRACRISLCQSRQGLDHLQLGSHVNAASHTPVDAGAPRLMLESGGYTQDLDLLVAGIMPGSASDAAVSMDSEIVPVSPKWAPMASPAQQAAWPWPAVAGRVRACCGSGPAVAQTV